MENSYGFFNTEVKEEEDLLVTMLEVNLERYKKCLLEVMENDLRVYEEELLKRKISDIEIKVLVEQRARRFERCILNAEKIKELLKTYINRDVIFRGEHKFFEIIKKEVV